MSLRAAGKDGASEFIGNAVDKFPGIIHNGEGYL